VMVYGFAALVTASVASFTQGERLPLVYFLACLSGWLPITLLGESTYHCRASRKWVLRHAPRDRGQS
jgi:hypothetical protein